MTFDQIQQCLRLGSIVLCAGGRDSFFQFCATNVNNKNVIRSQDVAKKPMINDIQIPEHGKLSSPLVEWSFSTQADKSLTEGTRKEKKVSITLFSVVHPFYFTKCSGPEGFIPMLCATHKHLLAVATPLQCFPVQSR